MNTNRTDKQYSKQETQRRFERLVKSALNTRPMPLKSMAKGMPSQSKKRRKRAKKAA